MYAANAVLSSSRKSIYRNTSKKLINNSLNGSLIPMLRTFIKDAKKSIRRKPLEDMKGTAHHLSIYMDQPRGNGEKRNS